MVAIYKYNVRNIETGDEAVGLTGKQLEDKYGLKRQRLPDYCNNYKKYKKIYEIVRLRKDNTICESTGKRTSKKTGRPEKKHYSQEDIETMQKWDSWMKNIRRTYKL
jgi:hypothetical protein